MAKTGPRRRGTLYWTKTGWRARVTIDVDGVPIKKAFDLETTNKAVARVKLKRLTAANRPPSPVEAARAETFREAAERIVEASAIRSKPARKSRLRRHILPLIGDIPITVLRAADVAEVLKAAVTKGLGKQSATHLRNDISAILSELVREEALTDNLASKVRVPKGARVDRRERAVLSDEELVTYLAWVHPDESKQAAVLERQTMACVSRMFGGLRLGDIRAIRWESFDIDGGEFPSGWAPRSKTQRNQLLEVPAVLRPILRDWWERSGRSHEGPLFPVRRGERAGKERKASSPAKALRRDLARAFGLEEPRPITRTRSNERQDTRLTWTRARPPTLRERELLEETEFTRPVDFHSFRRAFKQALADAGVELQQAMALSGATDVKAHQRYLNNTARMRRVPARALPQLDIAHVSFANRLVSQDEENSVDDQCRRSDLNRRPRAYEAQSGGRNQHFPAGNHADDQPASCPNEPSPGGHVQLPCLIDRELAHSLLCVALKGMADRIALRTAGSGSG